MHAFVRTELLAKEAERGAETSSFRWNCNEWGVPINQHDMAATTLLFSKELLDGLVALGTSVSAEAREDYMHLWRIGGHLMGVVSELLPTSTADGAALTAMILATQGDPDDDSRALAQALFASGAQAAQNEAERTLARRQGVLLRAVSRELLGDKIADALGVQPTPFQKVIPVVKRMIASAERVQKLTGDGAAVKAGTAYWNTLRDVGLSRYGFGFELPTLLAME
jgi:hypothetical protein